MFRTRLTGTFSTWAGMLGSVADPDPGFDLFDSYNQDAVKEFFRIPDSRSPTFRYF